MCCKYFAFSLPTEIYLYATHIVFFPSQKKAKTKHKITTKRLNLDICHYTGQNCMKHRRNMNEKKREEISF